MNHCFACTFRRYFLHTNRKNALRVHYCECSLEALKCRRNRIVIDRWEVYTGRAECSLIIQSHNDNAIGLEKGKYWQLRFIIHLCAYKSLPLLLNAIGHLYTRTLQQVRRSWSLLHFLINTLGPVFVFFTSRKPSDICHRIAVVGFIIIIELRWWRWLRALHHMLPGRQGALLGGNHKSIRI